MKDALNRDATAGTRPPTQTLSVRIAAMHEHTFAFMQQSVVIVILTDNELCPTMVMHWLAR